MLRERRPDAAQHDARAARAVRSFAAADDQSADHHLLALIDEAAGADVRELRVRTSRQVVDFHEGV
ncbi:MAG: hypothetical protein KY433_03355, partial [Actinobacteria bacterium]|nr:hypothetical protein [Actinomycetota bacterium]